MSYILEALRKVEEKEAEGAGGGRRFSGGKGPPEDHTGRKILSAGVVALLATVAFVAFFVGSRVGGDAVKEETTSRSKTETGGEDRTAAAPSPGARPAGEAGSGIPGAADRSIVQALATGRVRVAEGSGYVPAAGRKEAAGLPAAASPDALPPTGGEHALHGSADENTGAVAGLESEPDPELEPVDEADTVPDPGRLYRYEELPPEMQSDLGSVKITGHIYSEDPAFRLIMVDDGVRREGDMISPGIKLKAITARGVRLTYKGYTLFLEAF